MKCTLFLFISLCLTMACTTLKSQSNTTASSGLISANDVVIVATTPNNAPVNFYISQDNNTWQYKQIVPEQGSEWRFVCQPCKGANCYQPYYVKNSNSVCPTSVYVLNGGHMYRIIKDVTGCFTINCIR